MKTVTLNRTFRDSKETKGLLTTDGFKCDTLELPWLNNQHDISCIPAATYQCDYTLSNHLTQLAGHPISTYEILNVPNRGGIRIHSGNFNTDILGCVIVGSSYSDINGDGEPDIINSRITLAQFETLMNHEPFTLIITESLPS